MAIFTILKNLTMITPLFQIADRMYDDITITVNVSHYYKVTPHSFAKCNFPTIHSPLAVPTVALSYFPSVICQSRSV